MSEPTDELREALRIGELEARNRAGSFRWMADRQPRPLTREELNILAREAEHFAGLFWQALEYVREQTAEKEPA